MTSMRVNKKCRNCDNDIPNKAFIDDQWRNLQQRKFCLECTPFGSGNTRADLNKIPQITVERILSVRSNAKIRRQLNRNKAAEYMGGKCHICGYSRCRNALEFHHKIPEEKVSNLSRLYSYSWEHIKKELDKCIMLCANCHREVEAGMHDSINI